MLRQNACAGQLDTTTTFVAASSEVPRAATRLRRRDLACIARRRGEFLQETIEVGARASLLRPRFSQEPGGEGVAVGQGKERAPVSDRQPADRLGEIGEGRALARREARHGPQPRRPVLRGGHDGAPVRAEAGGVDRAPMQHQHAEILPGRGLPQARRAVGRGGHDEPSVGAEAGGQNGIVVPQDAAHHLAGANVPDPRIAVLGSGHDQLVVAAELGVVDRPLMPQRRRARLARESIPDADGLIIR